MKKLYDAIGIMSGTSLDGLDIAYCEFRIVNNKWEFDILEAETINYPQVWLQLLTEAPFLDGLGLTLLNSSYGHWIGLTVDQFIKAKNIHPKLIASHGHTIFHRPDERMTLQIGNGAAIAAETGITTVSDFRTLDVALGGQGAPLVPIGDRLLFSDYTACVNIGGFANISMELNGKRNAFDICAVNIILNHLANKIGLPFDASGNVAKSGNLNQEFLDKLNNLEYYSLKGPKSLGREWVEKIIIPMINESNLSVPDLMRTYSHHAAYQISDKLPSQHDARTIFTGGGAHNNYLIELISGMVNSKIVVPDSKIIDFKESLIFALLGVLRMEGMTNCLADATGARVDCSGGVISLPPKKNTNF